MIQKSSATSLEGGGDKETRMRETRRVDDVHRDGSTHVDVLESAPGQNCQLNLAGAHAEHGGLLVRHVQVVIGTGCMFVMVKMAARRRPRRWLRFLRSVRLRGVVVGWKGKKTGRKKKAWKLQIRRLL